jgi:hypothetical protein
LLSLMKSQKNHRLSGVNSYRQLLSVALSCAQH